MGLDNGIILRTRKRISEDNELLKVKGIEQIHDISDDDGFFNYDICYWRRCWNIRSLLLDNCQKEEDPGYYPMTIQNLINFRTAIFNTICAGAEAWDYGDYTGSVWSFDDMITSLAYDLVRLTALIKYLKEEGAGLAEAYMYDSY